MRTPASHAALTEILAREGFLSAPEEAALLIAKAGNGGDLDALVARRIAGEPLAWIIGVTTFCGLEITVHPGVYVPRWQTQELAHRAAARLPDAGSVIDVCCGSGAIARYLMTTAPLATVVACDIDAAAVACARANGVDAYAGDLFAALPERPPVDVIVGVVPYVPTAEMEFLQRDTFTFETTLAYDGGDDGTTLLERVVREGAPLLTNGGALLLELGGDQASGLGRVLRENGFSDVREIVDEDGDVRGVEATRV